MLKDRVSYENGSFLVRPEREDARLYYSMYSYREKIDYIPKDLVETGYWDLQKGFRQQLNDSGILYLEERVDGEVVDSCRMYCGKKENMDIRIEKAPKKYRDTETMITVSWNGEPFNSDYIYVYLNQKSDDKIHFLSDMISNLSGEDGAAEDVYLIREKGEYKVGLEPLLQEKYSVTFS